MELPAAQSLAHFVAGVLLLIYPSIRLTSPRNCRLYKTWSTKCIWGKRECGATGLRKGGCELIGEDQEGWGRKAVSTGIHAFGGDVRVLRIFVAINYLNESAVTGSPVGTDFAHFDASEAQKDDPVIPGRMDADFVAAVDRLSPRRLVHHWFRHRSIDVHRLVAPVFCFSAMHASE